MAMLFASAPRILNIAARRESLAVTAAVVVAFSALAYAHRSGPEASAPVDQGWTGHLTAAASADVVPVEPLRSSSLVVPKASLTLPPLAARPMLHEKKTCDSADRLCVVRLAPPVIAVPPRRQVAAIDPQNVFLPPALIPMPAKATKAAKPVSSESKGFSLNPLNHVPDMSALGRPFSAAGQAVVGWIKWL
ncbi:hypothetical protein [Beijerinckia sp. L45]|uniref:hypothetical protein n=1 Tax=Beijerinckia sp. L45 TaxID=1641855 RepID=UPI00131E36F4|nr:hypothetical protein [Beijerinckia sp. L45]